MAKDNTNLTDTSMADLRKKLSVSQKSKRELSFELKAGKGTVLKDYRINRKNIARIKTELAKRG